VINPAPVVVAETRRAPGGVVAVVALIALATALGVAISATERGLRTGSARAADAFDLLIGARGSPAQLVLSVVYLEPAPLDLVRGRTMDAVSREPGVAWAAPVAFGDSYRGAPVIGSTVDLVTRGGRLTPSEGRVFRSLHEVVVGADVPLRVGDEFAPSHGEGSARGVAHDDDVVHTGFEYAVVGRLPRSGTPWDRAIVAPIEAVWRVHSLGLSLPASEHLGPPWPADAFPGASAIVVKTTSVAAAYRLRARHRTETMMALFPAEVLVDLYALLGDAQAALATLAMATQALVVAAILLAVFASLGERRRSLAVLRALGASRAFVFGCVWLHVSAATAAGASLGLGLGWLGALGLARTLEARMAIALPVSLAREEMLLVTAIIAAGCVLSTLPAWWAYRQPVTASLRAS
jgi:putative ABC transport system permease protein